MNKAEIILEFNKIKEMLCGYAMSEPAKQKLSELTPFLSERECRSKMEETTEARRILDSSGNPPLSAIKDIGNILVLCEKGAMLLTEQLECVSTFIASCKRMKGYLKKAESMQVGIAYYGQSICDLSELQGEIEMSIQNAAVLSSASAELRNIRRKIENENMQMKKKLDDLLRSKKNIFSDGYVSLRNGRYVVPVKKEYKNQISGTVVDISGTGGTYFIEPAATSKLQDNINLLKIEEDNEIRKILYTLTALVDAAASEIKINMEAMVTLDIAFAKAKLSIEMDAIAAVVDTARTIEIRQGRHPLLRRDECVPLDFNIGGDTTGVVITGPNTGGKTVALKTVGLLSMMAQSGLHVPIKSGKFCMNNMILCDIGDGQSITENLSTFSAHITNVIDILRSANQDSLVLLDELGSGTDPAEGMGIAISILEELRSKKCLFLATTHYPEVKEYAAHSDGLINARMAFDRESLKPLYQLEIGEAGESCALYIAQRLGFPVHMLERAHQEAYSLQPRRKARIVDFDTGRETAPQTLDAIAAPKIQKDQPMKQNNSRCTGFGIGDSVILYPERCLGLVFQAADEKGQIGVQVKGKKFFVNHKRLKLKTPASELYPSDYDFSILFDTVENRKVRHKMEKRHLPGLEITLEKPDR
ncbi:endonuclease MutS2 [Hydrogenoanaerobacterium sp.]|uniref:endonuclease MutS2 n=1 Tax=Hydrogenoanaerobacterium sp. TaxID=2953763 RepID=UPI0037BE5FDC